MDQHLRLSLLLKGATLALIVGIGWIHPQLAYFSLAGLIAGLIASWTGRLPGIALALLAPYVLWTVVAMLDMAPWKYVDPGENVESVVGFYPFFVMIWLGILLVLWSVYAAERLSGGTILSSVICVAGAVSLTVLFGYCQLRAEREDRMSLRVIHFVAGMIHGFGMVLPLEYRGEARLPSREDRRWHYRDEIVLPPRTIAAMRTILGRARGDRTIDPLAEVQRWFAPEFSRDTVRVSWVDNSLVVRRKQTRSLGWPFINPRIDESVGGTRRIPVMLPLMRVGGWMLAPGPGSTLLILAPAGCTTDTHPPLARLAGGPGIDTVEVPVAFPGGRLSPYSAMEVWEEPGVATIGVTSTRLCGRFLVGAIRRLLTWPGSLFLFVAAALASRAPHSRREGPAPSPSSATLTASRTRLPSSRFILGASVVWTLLAVLTLLPFELAALPALAITFVLTLGVEMLRGRD